jgi:hypothetical protein
LVSPIPAGAFHASRQDLARSLDFQEVARNTDAMDRALSEATALVESELHRGFFPWIGSRSFNWPDADNDISYRIRLNDNELISLTSVVAGGTTLTASHVLLYPTTGPPYTSIETSLAFSDVFKAGSTWQNAVVVTGTWGYRATTRAATTLVGTITSGATTLVLADSSTLGVGDVLLLDSEYVVVRGLSLATTGQTLQTPLTASAAGTSVAVTTGSAYVIGETITLDAEQMLVVDIAANTLIVRRAWNGSVLATHTGSTIFAPRTYTVDRGACGSTAAAHTTGITVYQHTVPAAVEAVCLAEASSLYEQHASGWQMASKSSDRNAGSLGMLADLRANARRAVGRKGRQRSI